MDRFELADAMIKGLKTYGVIESRAHYLSSDNVTCLACALGSALIGDLNGDFHEAEFILDSEQFAEDCGEYDAFSKLLNIPVSLAIEIEHKHLNGMPIEQIAAWLKSSECLDVEVLFNV